MIGTELAHFKISSKLGEGGMGEVYQAEDTKLGREVAIKVLPEVVSQDPERLARFEREARVLASLNHPNIAGIHQVEEADGVHFLVMELAEGEDLAERIARGPIPVDEALPIALQMTEAMEAAHEAGVIHRDLKPANIKVDAAGDVKVLDFGLAKALDPAARNVGEGLAPSGEGSSPSPTPLSMSPTLTAQMTGVGVILGTAAYMSPEQAKGKPVDKRSDIWSFGVVLWEMLTGEKLFGQEETVSEVLAAVLTREPDLNALPGDTPTAIRHLLNRCLDREPKNRLRDIGEARLALQAAFDGDEPINDKTGSYELRGRRGALFLLAGAIAGLILGALITWLIRPPAKNAVIKLEVPAESLWPERDRHPLISPDGKRILVPGRQGLMVRSLNEMSARRIPGSKGARYPCWSPDSQSVAFVVGIEIRKVSVQGGDPTPVALLPADVGGSGGMVWTASGHFLVAGGDKTGVLQVPVRGGDFQEVLELTEGIDTDFHELSLLPNGQDLAFVVHRQDPASEKRLVDTLAVFANGARKDVLTLEGDSLLSVVYSPPGFLLFHRATNTPGVWALPFSLKELKATGAPFLVAADSWLPSVSSDGMLLLVQGLDLPSNEIVEVDRRGNLIRTIAQIEGDGEAPDLSPDGSRLAITTVEGGNWDIRIYDLAKETDSRFTFENTFDVAARWSPAGDEILYSVADTRQLKIKPVDSSGEAKTVGEGLAPSWIPDGSGFIFEHYSDETESWNISYKLLDEEEMVPLLTTAYNEVSATISPDGRTYLYVSDETGTWEVFARPFPAGDGKWQVSTAGGVQPQWSSDGREIYFLEESTLMAVEVPDAGTFSLGKPLKLMETNSLATFDAVRFATFKAGLDRQSLFLVRPAEDGVSPNRLMLIQNWYEEFGGNR